MSNYLWTSEYVSMGHPDKVADQISDALLDAYLDGDKNSRVAIETLVKDNTVVVAGEVKSNVSIDVDSIVRKTINDIGYNHTDMIFYGGGVDIIKRISQQSNEINNAVDNGNSIGAGDQGIMFGYASSATPNAMPLTIYLASELINSATSYRLMDNSVLHPDMKSQVTVEYNEYNKPERIDTVVFSTCHSKNLSLIELQEYVHSNVIYSFMDKLPTDILNLFDAQTKFLINSAGTWTIGGPVADAGLTGRKIVVDQYGADCPIGGGAFSGKDYTKIDRSGAYAARHIAKHYSSIFNTDVQVQLSYAIGIAEPVSVRIQFKDNGSEMINFRKEFLTPDNIRQKLKLDAGIYLETARNGHFGKTPFTRDSKDYYLWETSDKLLLI